jgi:hypothetical protein
MKKILLLFLCLLATAITAQNTTHILPTPQQVEWGEGIFLWDAQAIDSMLVDHLDVPRNEDQAYRLTVTSKGILMEATTETGLFYARQSLNQLYRYASLTSHNGSIEIPCMILLDWPDFKLRGWQDDISRGPIVSMAYLKQLIPQLAECKLNAFSLYTEHTFRTESHPDIAPADAFTADEIRELDAFCKQYHIELIGNQQCFAHFEEILCNPAYAYLADAPDNLNPGIEATYAFLEDLISEEAQAYSSPLFNINCDETESLGTGKAKAYVDAIGRSEAYWRHINRVNEIVKRHGKQAMMWGDIADQDPEILENLDKDIIFLAWSYAARDRFDDFLAPYATSGHAFMVAPSVSLSSRVMPYRHDYTSDIPHLCRDGFRYGAFGVLNTCWDDFGESFVNSALYGLALGAEMSWNPLKSTDPAQADAEEQQRDLRRNFCIHFFDNAEAAAYLFQPFESVERLSETNDIGRFSVLWEPMVPFYPSQVGDSVEAYYRQFLEDELLYGPDQKGTAHSLHIFRPKAKKNPWLFDHARYALHRIRWCVQRNLARCQLYRTYQHPTKENVLAAQRQLDSLLADLPRLKEEYAKIWEQECRPYWLDVNLKKYDDKAWELQTLPYHPFIETSSDEEGHPVVGLKTLYGDQPIHFTLNGKEVAPSDPIYTEPLILDRSSLVKAACFDPEGHAVRNERHFLYHKGMGKLKVLNSPAGNYRPEYSGGGDNALLDGQLGGTDYKDGHWQGFYGIDADLELDFKRETSINGFELGFLVNPHDWILRPNEVELYVSDDGIHYRLVLTYNVHTDVEGSGNVVFRESFETPRLRTRYLRIVVKNPGLIPEGFPGHGYDSWIFMDELLIK